MLQRKFTTELSRFLQEEPDKIMLVNGARQIGKSYLIRYVSQQQFAHYIEINLQADKEGARTFANVHSVQDFYVQLGIYAGQDLGNREDTIVFLDEIQAYPHLLTLLKFLNQDARYRYIASGSQLGIALKMTPSTPMGSIAIKQMYPLDLEEFLWAMGANSESISAVRSQFEKREMLNESLHDYLLRMFRYYLIVGGMPEAVNQFVLDQNIAKVRAIQKDIIELYRVDASQYDEERKLKIRIIYDLIPSLLENKKKRVVYRDIEHIKSKRYEHYEEEFDYLTASGVAMAVRASVVRVCVRMCVMKAIPRGSDNKESACSEEDSGSTPGSGRSPGEGNGNPLQYYCLENSTDSRAWRATVHGVAKRQT